MEETNVEKEHLEILLEDIQSKFELVLEGHDSLRKEIRDARGESNGKHEHTIFLINTLNKKIDAVETRLEKKIGAVETRLEKKIDAVETKLEKKIDAVGADLAAHRADTETHKKAFQVAKGKK